MSTTNINITNVNGAKSVNNVFPGVNDNITLETSNILTNQEVLDLASISNKVDKVTGKGLSTEDYTTTEKNKLEGIQAGAQVNPDLSGYALISQTVSNGDITHSPSSDAVYDADINTLASATSYADSLVVGLWDDRGNYNASSNVYPTTGGSGTAGAILKGDIWTISVAGTLPTGRIVEPGDTLRALINNPGSTSSNWAIQQNNIGYTPENSANKNVSNGYCGLSGYKLIITSNDGSYSSLIQNLNTSTRTYTLQNRNGIIADDTDLALKADKLASIQTVTSSATVTPVIANDIVRVTALATGVTIANMTSPTDGKVLFVEIKDNATPQTIAVDTDYEWHITAVTTTTASKWLTIGMIYNGTDSKWHILSATTQP